MIKIIKETMDINLALIKTGVPMRAKNIEDKCGQSDEERPVINSNENNANENNTDHKGSTELVYCYEVGV